jgi:hypothetical protein
VGLPEEAAGFEFTAVRNGLLRPFTEDDGEGDGQDDADAPPALDGRLILLGETDCWGARLVLDGETGGVHLVTWEGVDLHHDLVATGLPQLAGLIREIEAVSGTPRQAAPDEPRGLAAMAEARAASERRMREIDPELFAAYAETYAAHPEPVPPAHWGTVLRTSTLYLAARPDPSGDLAYELEPALAAQLVDELAEGAHVRRFTGTELPPALTHTPTVRLLTQLGLPTHAEMFAITEGPLRTMGESNPDYVDEENGYSARGYQRAFLALGWWPPDLPLALDGATGRVEVPDWFGPGSPAAYLHQDLSALLFACWTCRQVREEWARWDLGAGGQSPPWQVFTPTDLLEARIGSLVKAVDPDAWATEWHSWQQMEDDDHTGGLL